MKTLGLKETRLPPQMCLRCGHLLDAASSLFVDTKPEPGNATICLECQHVMVFTEELKLREPNEEEAAQLAEDKEILATKLAIRRVQGGHA